MITTLTESGLRKAANRRGYKLVKGKDMFGNEGYMIVDADTKFLIAGGTGGYGDFQMSAEDVRNFLNEE